MHWLHTILKSRYGNLPDRPVANPDGSTRYPNVYVTGTLAGEPNIKAALLNGYAVGQRIAAKYKQSPYKLTSCVGIVGAGPAGTGVALALRHHDIDFIIWERGEWFNSIASYTVNKHIYALPEEWSLPENLWFEDCNKEALLERWKRDLKTLRKNIHESHDVTDIRQYNTIFNVYVNDAFGNDKVCRIAHVVLATGTQSTPKKLGVVGEDLPLVNHHLLTPLEYKGKRVAIIGGGNSAVESCVRLLEQGTHCKLIHRGHDFSKALPALREKLQQWKNTPLLEIHLQSTVQEFRPFPHSNTQLTVTIQSTNQDGPQHLLTDGALIQIGGKAHSELLDAVDIQTEQEHPPVNWLWAPIFGLLVYLFYILKSGLTKQCPTLEDCTEPLLIAKRNFFPMSLDWFSHLPSLLQVDLGFRTVNGSFWGTVLYSTLIVTFGIKAMFKYPSLTQRKRYLSLMIFQALFLFGIPEIIAPWIISTGHGLDFFGGERAWKWYALTIPWPLSLYSIVDAPNYIDHTNKESIALMWTGLGLTTSFVLIPLYVRHQGQRFCSYMCGCGGLAETVGDIFRSYAPKGNTAKKIEQFGRWVWVLGILVTALILNDAWQLISIGALTQTKVFAERWYSLMVDFWLASVLGVALYPYLGNRVWCRFACPLRAYMETVAKYTTKLSIESKDTCIGCFECTRQCQMGINVHEFALRQESLTNQNSACIQCGICIEVCPLDVLQTGKAGQPIQFSPSNILEVPKARWE